MMMKGAFLVAVVSAVGVGVSTAQTPCDVTKLGGVVTSADGKACAEAAKFKFVPPSKPTDEQVKAMCETAACKSVVEQVKALELGDCVVGNFKVQEELVNYVSGQCGWSTDSASPGAGGGSAGAGSAGAGAGAGTGGGSAGTGGGSAGANGVGSGVIEEETAGGSGGGGSGEVDSSTSTTTSPSQSPDASEAQKADGSKDEGNSAAGAAMASSMLVAALGVRALM